MKILFYIPAFLLFISCNSALSQNQMGFGLNLRYDDPVLNRLINSNFPIKSTMDEYHIQYLRMPGGVAARSFFWDRPDLIPAALNLYSDFVQNTNSAKAAQKSKYTRNLSKKETVKQFNYTSFLQFCKSNNITPVIQLNAFAYHDENNVYPIVDVNSNTVTGNMNLILQNIEKQLRATHAVLSNVYWEIGNEDEFIYTAKVYSEIADAYSKLIKKLYPNDKVIIEFSAPGSDKVDENWNSDLLSNLNQTGSINNIDYIAPHYYKNYDKVLNTQQDINALVKHTNIVERTGNMINLIRNYPNLKIFYTEFGVFRNVQHVNFNSQSHAMIMLYYLMLFNSSPSVEGVIYHGFTQGGTGLFFDESTFQKLNYSFPLAANQSSYFKYVSPEALAVKCFFDNNPVKSSNYSVTNNYCYTVSNSNGNTIVNILNFSSDAVPVDINRIISGARSSSFNIKSYLFDDLTSKQWSINSTSYQQSKATNSHIVLNKYSYNVISF